jgi:dTDP-4-amino-4,6-dideoxygalactose transaminase
VDNPYDIPFNRPSIQGTELTYVAEAVAAGQIAGDGAFTKRCHALLESSLGVGKALLTPSCTQALEMAALLLNVKAGDEVAVPSFTFVTTVNAFVLRGAKPVFVDCHEDTLNMNEDHLASLVNGNTRAIVPVHYAGVSCEMDAITTIAAECGAVIVEDNAHGLFAEYKGRKLGTLGAMATQSFHETKNFTAGEGGALLINDEAYMDRAEILREKGTDRSRFLRGEVDRYTWVDVGSSYLPSDLSAAFLLAQLEQRDPIQQFRKDLWDRYRSALAPWAAAHGVALPTVPPHCVQSYHMFYMRMPSAAARAGLINHLKKARILAVFHYQPLHLSTMGQQFGGREGDCPVTETVSESLVRLPFYNDLIATDQDRVIEAVTSFSP